MTSKTFLSLAAAMALGALPAAARAQDMMGHDHSSHGEGHEHTAPATAPTALTVEAGVRTIEMAVTSDGFAPAEVKVKQGERVRLVITRKTERTCATEILIKDYGIKQNLPLDKPVTVEFTPKKTGNVRYACGMDMIAGVLMVE